MAKGNIYLLKRNDVKKFSKTLVSRSSFDEAGKPLEFPFYVRKLSQLQSLTAMDRGNELVAKFVDGNEHLPPVDGQAVLPSKSACFIVGALLVAQAADEAECYADFELFGMMVDDIPGFEEKPEVVDGKTVKRLIRLPSLFEQVCLLADEVQPGDEVKTTDPLEPVSEASSSTPSLPKSDTPE